MPVNEALDIALGPLWLWRDGEVDVGDIGRLDERLAARGTFLGDDDDGAEA